MRRGRLSVEETLREWVGSGRGLGLCVVVLVHVCVICTRIPDYIYRTYSEYIIIWQLSIIIIWGMRQGVNFNLSIRLYGIIDHIIMT